METNKIYLGDCLELIKQVPSGSVDLILTDPPYFENLVSNHSTLKATTNDKINKNIKATNLKLMESINSPIKPKDGFPEAMRVLNDNKNMIVWLDDRNQLLDYLLEIKKYGLKYYTLIWQKNNAFPTGNPYLKDKEFGFYIFKKQVDYGDFQSKKTIFTSSVNNTTYTGNQFAKGHPTPKPIALMQRAIMKHTKEGDLVLDLFSGSGTTAVACAQMGRRYIAFELVEKGYKKSLERLRTEGQQMTGIK